MLGVQRLAWEKKEAVSATIHAHAARNAGKFDINFSSAAFRQEAVKASRANRPKNAQGEAMFISNKQTPMQDYKVKLLFKAMTTARANTKAKI